MFWETPDTVGARITAFLDTSNPSRAPRARAGSSRGEIVKMDWLTDPEDSGRRHGRAGVRLAEDERRAVLRRACRRCMDWLIDGVLWLLQAPPSARHHRDLRRAHLVRCSGPGRSACCVLLGLPVHPEPGLLGGDDRKPDAGPFRLRRLHGRSACRSASRRRTGPRLYAAMQPGARPDADAADLRLPDPGHRLLRPRHGAGPDRDGDLRAARADPADLSRRLDHAAGAARGGDGLRRDTAPDGCGRWNCPMPSRRSWRG